MSTVFPFSLENYNFGSQNIYMDSKGGLGWQMLISALNLSGFGRTIAIYMYQAAIWGGTTCPDEQLTPTSPTDCNIKLILSIHLSHNVEKL